MDWSPWPHGGSPTGIKTCITVNDLFRAALRQTARLPNGAGSWDSGLGTGIVDALALLELDLDKIKPKPMSAVASNSSPFARHAEIAELAQRGEVVDGFDWRRHGAEAVYLSSQSLARTHPELASLTESPAKPRPSESLAETKLPDVLLKVLKGVDDAPAAAVATPWVARGRNGSVFGEMHHGGLEDLKKTRARREGVETTFKKFGGDAGLEGLVRNNEKIIAQLNETVADEVGVSERSLAMNAGLEAFKMIESGSDPLELSLDMRIGIEALVRLTGRPAFKIVDNGISQNDPMFGDGGWGRLLIGLPILETITKAVGRINLGTEHVGTGFVVGEDLIMTNRHVLEAIGEEVQTSRGANWVFPYGRPHIDFSEQGIGGTAFDVLEVAFAGPTPTHGKVNFKTLDLVLLKVKTGPGFPDRLQVRMDPEQLRENVELFVVGFPARPGAGAFVDPKTGKFDKRISERFGRIFGIDYGRKYLSPGKLTTPSGGFGERDPKDWVFAHDATTSGGNSGSLIIPLSGNGEVAGLHFAGAVLSGNFAHELVQTGIFSKLNV